MQNKKSIAGLVKNTVIIAVGKFSTQFLTFFLLPLYTSRIPTSDYGVVDLIVSYTSLFVPVVTLQQEFAVFRYLIDARNNNSETGEIISTGLSTVSSVLVLTVFVFLPFFLIFDIPYKWFIIPNIIAISFSNYFLQVSRGTGKTYLYSLACILSGAVTILSNLVLVLLLGLGAESILISSILANFASVLLIVFKLKLYSIISIKSINSNLRKELLKYSIPIVFNGISWWIINTSDRTMIAAIISVSASGVYAIANNFPSIISSIFYVFSMAWSESASLHMKSKGRDSFYSLVFNCTIRLFSSLSAFLISCLPFILPLLVKAEYTSSFIYIPLLIIGALLNSIAGYYAALYGATKDTKKVMTTTIYASIINVAINAVFIGVIGVWATVISTIIAFFTIILFRHYDISKTIKIKIDIVGMLESIGIIILSVALYYYNSDILKYLAPVLIIALSLIINIHTISTLKSLLLEKFIRRH